VQWSGGGTLLARRSDVGTWRGSFVLQETARETHYTPFGSTQEFWYSRLKRVT